MTEQPSDPLVDLLIQATRKAKTECSLFCASTRNGYSYECKCGWETCNADQVDIHNAQALARAICALKEKP